MLESIEGFLASTYIMLGIAYASLIITYLSGWKRLPILDLPTSFTPDTSLSIIIPARNEAENIIPCLHSILAQNYPNHLFEILVVDDCSTDNTAALVESLQHPNIQLLSLERLIKQKGGLNSYKKLGISLAVQKAKGELIITTDADCVVPPTWLNHFSYTYQTTKAKMIAAPVNFHEENNLLEKFQSLDFMGMMLITGAGIHDGWMRMCNGANLAYTKAIFLEVNGFQGVDHLASGDDLLLMHKIASKYPNDIAFIKSQTASVRTQAKPDWSSFWQQRIRWASKTTSYQDWRVTMVAAIVFLFCCSIPLAFLSAVFFGVWFIWLGLCLALLKNTVDFLFLRKAATFFNRKDLLKSFLPAQLYHLIYIIGIGILAQFVKEYEWKGRKVR